MRHTSLRPSIGFDRFCIRVKKPPQTSEKTQTFPTCTFGHITDVVEPLPEQIKHHSTTTTTFPNDSATQRRRFYCTDNFKKKKKMNRLISTPNRTNEKREYFTSGPHTSSLPTTVLYVSKNIIYMIFQTENSFRQYFYFSVTRYA